MNMFFRLLLHVLRARFRQPCSAFESCVTPFRVWPTDLDLLGHMNNGVYFSIMDIGRVDMLIRSGLWSKFKANGIYPVIAAETMRFRRSLQLFQRFYVQTKVIGWDDKAFLLEQVFLRPYGEGQSEVIAEGVIRARFLRRRGGVVAASEVLAMTDWRGGSPAFQDWIRKWNSAQVINRSDVVMVRAD